VVAITHPGSGTMFLSITACLLLFIVAGTGATNISLSDHSFVSSEASFIIYKDPSLSDSTSMSSVYLELVLVLLIVYTIYVYLSSSSNFI